jgi:hypothetical protein
MKLHAGLPPLPPRIARLPLDGRGFPVPWFVQWFKDGEPGAFGIGEPDFRVIDSRKLARAIKHPHCWVCGEQMGVHRVFLIGPMCAINRVISEPPSHRECAEFAAKACPFLANPRMRRNEKDLPKGDEAAGFGLKRNPKAVCLWETKDYRPFRAHVGNEGILFKLGDPVRVDWYANGRLATRQEVLESIDGGYPELERMALVDGPAALKELRAHRERVLPLLPLAA